MGEPIVIAATAAAGKPIVEKLFGKLLDWISKPVSLPLDCKSNVEDLKKKVAELEETKISKEMEKENVLVILDDIWAGIDLKEVGIPLKEADASGGNCEKLKILMTSRDCNVLEIQMSSQLNLPIGDLKYEEAWRLFEKIVGDKANDPELQPTAIGIVKECGGLPLAVATLANALKKGIPHEWRNALTKLKNPSPDNFTEVPKVVYTAIEFSYIQLKNEKLKRTFLLCCMMGRYASIEYLLRVGVGLGLFSRGNTIEDSRNELSTLIGDLKAASLLIGGSYDGCLDMHDLIHDVAIAIACKDHQGLLVSNNQELEELSDLEAVNGFKWVIMNLVDNSVLPYELEGPQLAFLHIHNQGSSLEIPENFFKRIESLKVLNLTRMHMPSSPSSPCFLENLHTLVLNESVLGGDMSIIGELKSLEILSLALSEEFEELPKEIAKLIRLKILDLWGCRKLKVIPPHVLESLSRLEELYLPRSFQRWKLGEHENQENASLAELKHLEKLTTLEIRIGNARMIPKDFLLVNFYTIWIGGLVGRWLWHPCVHKSRTSLTLELDLSEYQYTESPIKLLLKMATELHLKDSNGVMNAVDELAEGGFQNLKHLSITKASGLQHVFDSSKVLCPNLEELELRYLNISRIWHTTDFINASSFVENLAELTISNCNNLEYLFSSSMVKDLVKLRRLEISSCNQMKNVVVRENEEEMEKLIFPKLEFLEVIYLPKLVGFYIGNCSVEFPSLNKLSIEKCPNMKGFALKPTITSTEDSADIHTLFTKKAKFSRLEQLSIEHMESLNKIWDNQLADAFCQLSNLKIKDCDFLQEIVGSPEHTAIQSYDLVSTQPTSNDDEVKDGIVFDKLNHLELYHLKNLKSFCSLKSKIAFPSLDKAIVVGCPRMQFFSVGQTITPKLRKVDWTSDPNDEGSWKSDLNSTIQLMFIKKAGYSTLKSLDLIEFPELVAIWNERRQETLTFKMLTDLTVCNISGLTYLFTPSMVLDLVLLED